MSHRHGEDMPEILDWTWLVPTAAHLTDHVVPPLPVRQWVLAVPKPLRCFPRHDAGLQCAALRLFLRVVEQSLRAHSPGSGPRLGAVAFIHRFGSLLNVHPHFRRVIIDGLFDAAAAFPPPPPLRLAGAYGRFREISAATVSGRCWPILLKNPMLE